MRLSSLRLEIFHYVAIPLMGKYLEHITLHIVNAMVQEMCFEMDVMFGRIGFYTPKMRCLA